MRMSRGQLNAITQLMDEYGLEESDHEVEVQHVTGQGGEPVLIVDFLMEGPEKYIRWDGEVQD